MVVVSTAEKLRGRRANCEPSTSHAVSAGSLISQSVTHLACAHWRPVCVIASPCLMSPPQAGQGVEYSPDSPNCGSLHFFGPAEGMTRMFGELMGSSQQDRWW